MSMTMRALRPAAATAIVVALTAVATGAARPAHTAPAQVDPEILAADFGAYVLEPKDLQKVSGVKKAGPFESDGAAGTFTPAVPSPCADGEEGGAATYTLAARAAIGGERGAVVSTLGAVPDAAETLNRLEEVAQGCTSPYDIGETTYTPLEPQPELKTVGDGTLAFAAAASSDTTEYWIWVQRGPTLLSNALVVLDEPLELKDKDLNRLARRMNRSMAALERSIGQ